MNASSSETTQTNQQLNPVAVFAALGSDVRWSIIQLLADGTPRTATDVAAYLHRDFDGVSKHLRLMNTVGLLNREYGENHNFVFFSVPADNRNQPGKLDYGICTITMPNARPTIAKD